MFKSVYEFTKGFSILFFLSGVFFLFKEIYFLAFITIFSFFAIKFIDSDWAFDNLKFSNHNSVVIMVTFGLIFVNFFAIYQQMRFSPIFFKTSAEDKQSYLLYEESLYSAINPCVASHNELMTRLNENIPIYEADVKTANNQCYKVIETIDKQIIPDNFSSELKILCMRTKEEFKKISINLATFNYSIDKPQQNLILRVKENVNNSIESMLKAREIMHMTEELTEAKRTFVKI